MMDFRIPFAGEGLFPTPDSVFSHVRYALMPLFDTRDALSLRLTCKELKEAVSEHAWEDTETVIHGCVASWRACFPRAIAANVSRSPHSPNPVRDIDFVQLVGVKHLRMRECLQVTDAAFAYLAGSIRTLDMGECCQPALTDAAFVHLKGIQALNMAYCDQDTITGDAFRHLAGIKELNMSGCSQTTITDEHFAHLAGVIKLAMYNCPQVGDPALAHIAGVQRLDIRFNSQSTLTDAAFTPLGGTIVSLILAGCTQFSPAALAPLKGIHELNLNGCTQLLNDESLSHLAGIHTLSMNNHASFITDAGLAHIQGVKVLHLVGAPSTVTDEGLAHLRGIETLFLSYSQTSATDAGMRHLAGVKELLLCGTTQFTGAIFPYLSQVKLFSMSYCSSPSLQDSDFAHLKCVETLLLSGLFAPNLTRGAIPATLKHLDVVGCSPDLVEGARLSGISPLPPTAHGCQVVDEPLGLWNVKRLKV